jgi:hypothetical protein
MKLKLFGLTLVLLFAFVLSLPVANADGWNQATLLNFSQPVRIPGQTLAPGSYWFILTNVNYGDTSLVRIFNSSRTKLITTVQTASADRSAPTGRTVLTFAESERAHGRRPTLILLSWFYPGDDMGHAFLYSGSRERQLNRDPHVTLKISQGGSRGVEL